MRFPNCSRLRDHPGTGSENESVEGVSPNLTVPAGSVFEPAGCSTPPLFFNLVRFSNWPCCLIPGSKPCWGEALGERGGRPFSEGHVISPPGRGLVRLARTASRCLDTIWLWLTMFAHSFEDFSASSGGRATGSPCLESCSFREAFSTQRTAS